MSFAFSKHQVFIASYPADYCWLIHCLASLKRFSVGFAEPVVCVDENDTASVAEIIRQSYPEAKIVTYSLKPGMSGFMRAQIAMMRADEFCHDADYIYFLGSDCLAHAEFTPAPYFDEELLPVMLYSTYESMQVHHRDTIPWRGGVHRVLGFMPDNEYMRRLPLIYPKLLFGAMRKHVEKLHGMKFDEYIYIADAVFKNTSESNCLGAFAHKYMPSFYRWVDIAGAGINGAYIPKWPSNIGQFWSHGGLDRPMEACFTYLHKGVEKNSVGQTPRSVINQVLYGF